MCCLVWRVRDMPFLQVGAGAEGAAGTGEDRDEKGRLGVEPAVQRVEFVVARDGDAV